MLLGIDYQAAIGKSTIDFGVEIITQSNAPVGSGLDVSDSMEVFSLLH